MAYEESLRSITLNADATLAVYTGVPGQPGSADPNSGKQYHFVKVTGVHQVGIAAATGSVVGVIQNKPQNAGNAATVGIRGVSKVVSDVAITAGDPIFASADGQAAKTGSGPQCGVALTTTANPGELVSVLLTL
jgi:predicted RecA/RadA family phage recombinase